MIVTSPFSDSWKDNRRFRCIVVRSIEIDMVVSYFNNNYKDHRTRKPGVVIKR